ncbi:hypothetical protein CGMCC3_g5850 [Colletotrichum fructicola]|nr:uncharacterized protein CGMCC3_g5850 [Colletotrichum fructicola]KAE9578072.1 hypothetical protein CGMCC3_g5850 [Colletotrichum fructicola]KAF5504870.1 Cyclochlorotine biosynthesis protein R [Colletotrichum fructicola]
MGSGKPESSSYKLLSDDESSVDNGHVCGRCETSISEDRPSRSFSTLKLILAFVFCQIPILLLSFAVFRYILRSNERTSETYHKDDYLAFERYNATGTPYSIVDAADPSKDADKFWNDLKRYTGIVTVDDTWAERNHLPPTVKYPHDPQLRVYQVNVFHSLHCLYRIRNRLISNVSMEMWPRNDIHTMHCVDHLRGDYVQRRYDANEAERVNMALAGKGQWNKANSTHNKETGKIEAWFEDHEISSGH